MRLLILTNNLNIVNGITTFIYQQSKVLIENYNYEIFIASSGGDGSHKFKKLGAKLINKNFLDFEQRSYLNFILSIILCFYIIVRFRIQIINPQNHYIAAYSYYPSIILRKSFIQTVHDILGNLGRIKALFGQNFFAINGEVIKYVKKTTNKAEVTLVRCPIEAEKNDNIKSGKLKVVSSGRLVREKSFDVYLNAISNLNQDLKDKVEFFITGSGDCESELTILKNKLNIKVTFNGIIDDIDSFFEETHIFVMSTSNINEGMGLGIIQAALHKNLIITPKYNSIVELLADGQDGFLFGLGNSQELTNCLEYAIENYDHLEPMIESFYLKVKKEFSFEKNGKIFNSTYNSLMI